MRGQERKKENESERAETAAKGGKKKNLSLSLAALTFFPDVEHDLDVVAGHPGAAAASICVSIFFFGGGDRSGEKVSLFVSFEWVFAALSSSPSISLNCVFPALGSRSPFLAACSPKNSPSVRQQPRVSEKQDAAAKSNAEQHGQAPPETPVKASESAAEEVDEFAAEEFAAQESSASVG